MNEITLCRKLLKDCRSIQKHPYYHQLIRYIYFDVDGKPKLTEIGKKKFKKLEKDFFNH